MKEPGPTDYRGNETPTNYVCARCGAGGVKLWRQYQTFLNHIKLHCVRCACQDQPDENARPEDFDERGTRPYERGRTDSIGWLIPAIPTEAGDTFWGYTSTPPDGIEWWRRLPMSLPSPRGVRAETERRKP